MSFLYVKVYYGLSSTFSSNQHKPQFLTGLKDRLQKLGFRVDLAPVKLKNYCMIEMCGYEVFHCTLQNLHFNSCSDRDVVCMRAVNAVMEASVKFRRARAYLWFWTLIEHELFIRSKYGPRDFWLRNKYEGPEKKCIECSTCCDVLSKREDEYWE
ncbi:uncharacterized protein LOC113495228 [Trichoplusia ni]|uniref:Uncharacterized protein LOC113495228 n=1 Tax=Trichoplusia ni TaxID=7111 RepID=A0A7E5VN00_TRINI|nr:uncharacterized protein LOC113495228 [Trichoplusia ni]